MRMPMNLLTINGLTKSYTDKVLLDDVDFRIDDGDKIGIIGINGTGKSTLLKIISGLELSERGEVIKGNKVHIRYLPQNPEFPEGISIFDYVITRNRSLGNEWTIEGDAKTVLNRLGFSDYDQCVDVLSGGQRKRVALAAALMAECEILVMDEPTNHLDNDMTVWLENYLISRKGALVLVTHDRYFLDRVTNAIVEVDKGKLYRYDTNYSGFLSRKAERENIEDATERKRQSILRTEIEWMQRGARARSTKQKAHIARYEQLRDQTAPVRDSEVEIRSASTRMGRSTIELSDITKAYEGHTYISHFDYIFLKSDRVGFIGPNGCGKSTLMKIITGKLKPDSGSVSVGSTIKIGYFSQENEYMDEALRVIDYIRETAEFIDTGDGKLSASKMLERFLFDSTLQYQVIEKLSGGEKRRLYLLKVLMEAPNVIVLDEPTNDLDIQTLMILEDYLRTFSGIVITVSHDRYFLDCVVNRIFAFEEGGVLRQYEGGYSDYVEQHGQSFDAEEEKEEVNDTAASIRTWKQREKKKKFTYQEQKDYDVIDSQIAELEDKIKTLESAILASATDFEELSRLTQEKEETELLLNEKMERWMYLSELAEQIEGDES